LGGNSCESTYLIHIFGKVAGTPSKNIFKNYITNDCKKYSVVKRFLEEIYSSKCNTIQYKVEFQHTLKYAVSAAWFEF
jgi:hypothetical protein